MKKKTTPTTISGHFYASIAAYFKKADRVNIGTDPEHGTFSATDGYIVIRSDLRDYEDIIRPALQKDPAPGWYARDGKTWRRTAESQTPAAFLVSDKPVKLAYAAPFTFDHIDGLTVRPYYVPDTGDVIYFNTLYVNLFPEALTGLYITGPKSIAFLRDDGTNYAGLLPVRVNSQDYDRAVRAYFITEPADVEKLQRENAAVRADRAKVEEQLVAAENIGAGLARDLETANAEIERLSRELEAAETAAAGYAADLKEAEERAKEAEDRADEKPADEKPALNTAGLEKLDGVTVVIKGATTNKPVAWISGDTKKHAETLKKAGCKWSAKRSAWYLTA